VTDLRLEVTALRDALLERAAVPSDLPHDEIWGKAWNRCAQELTEILDGVQWRTAQSLARPSSEPPARASSDAPPPAKLGRDRDREWATKLLADLQFIGRDPVETVLAALAKRDAERHTFPNIDGERFTGKHGRLLISKKQEPSNADPILRAFAANLLSAEDVRKAMELIERVPHTHVEVWDEFAKSMVIAGDCPRCALDAKMAELGKGEDAWVEELWEGCGHIGNKDRLRTILRAFAANLRSQQPVELSAEDKEAVASIVHEQWMVAKRSQGVASRKSESGEELMVPYEQLSESVKDLDRIAVRSVLIALNALLREKRSGK
jgi:hypothetical protein